MPCPTVCVVTDHISVAVQLCPTYTMWIVGIVMLLGMVFLGMRALAKGMVTVKVRIQTQKVMIWVRNRVKGEKVIWIQESPGPTQHDSTPSRPSPLMPTTPIRRNRGSPASVMRGGTRIRAHRRRSRVVFNPAKKGHCGFEALAWIGGLPPTMKNIKKMREVIAMSIIDMYKNDDSVQGVRVREEIDLMGIGVLKYASLLKRSMWAAPLDLMVGATRLGVCCSIRTPTMEVCTGNGEIKYRIDLVEKHYIVKTYDKKGEYVHENGNSEHDSLRNSFLKGSQEDLGLQRAGAPKAKARGQPKGKPQPKAKQAPWNRRDRTPSPEIEEERPVPRERSRSRSRSPQQVESSPEREQLSPTVTFDPAVPREFHDEVRMYGRGEEDHDDDSNNDSVHVFRSWATPTRPTDFPGWSTGRFILSNMNFATNWRVRAHPLSAADDVAETVREHFGLENPPMVQPRDALWWEVTRFRLPPPILPEEDFLDLREGVWEARQPLRVVPLLERDLMTIRRTVVFGLRTDPNTIVERLQSLPDIRQQLRLEVIPGNVWVAIVDRPRVFPVPVYTVQRGGMKQGGVTREEGEIPHHQQQQQQQELQSILHQEGVECPDLTREHQIVEVFIPERPAMTTYLSMPATHTAENVVRDVALRFVVDPEEVEVRRSATVSDIIDKPGTQWFLPHKVLVPDCVPALNARDLALRWEGRPRSTSWMAVEEHWSTEYILGEVSRMNGLSVGSFVPKVNGVIVEPYVRVREYIMDTMDLCMLKRTRPSERGGVRGRRTTIPNLPTSSSDTGVHHRNHVQAMQSWASTRILEVVDLDRCVVKNLVRTEMRTTTAVLNARSSQQVRHAVRAALHRNGYRELAIKMDKLIEKGDEEELRPRERSRSIPREPDVTPPWQKENTASQSGPAHQPAQPAHPPQDHEQVSPSQPPTLPDPMVATMRMDISNVQTSIYRMAQMLTTQQQAIAMLSQQLVALHQGQVQSMVEIASTVRGMSVDAREIPEVDHGTTPAAATPAATTPPATPPPGPMTPERHQERIKARSETYAQVNPVYATPCAAQEEGPPLPSEHGECHALLSPEIPTQVGDTSPTQTQSEEVEQGLVKAQVQQIEERHALKPFRKG